MIDSNEILKFLERSPDLVSILSLDGYFKMLNEAWSVELGYSKEELLSQPFTEYVHPDDIELTIKMISQLSLGSMKSAKIENRYIAKDGEVVWLAWTLTADEGKIFGIAKNISEIKNNEEYLEEIQQQAKIGGWTLDIKTFETSWTDETYHIYEIPVGEVLNAENGINFYHPDHREKISNCITRCIEEKIPWDEEFKFITAKERHIWVRATGHPLVGVNGEVTKLVGTFQDIDLYKKIANSLDDATSQLEDVLKNSPGMVYQFQLEPCGKMFFPYTSPQAFDIYEIRSEDFNKDPAIMLNMCHPDERGDLQQKIEESAKNMAEFEWDGRIVTPRGQIKWIKAKSKPRLLDSGAILWNGIIVDTSRENQLENDLKTQKSIAEHSARLASIGELAAGVGHEINNPLAIILGLNSKILKSATEKSVSPESLLAIAEKQKDACMRIKKIVDGLRSFSRAGGSGDSISNLNDSVRTTVALIEEIYLNLNIKIELILPDGMVNAKCDATHVQQVFMNLLTNAKDALENVAHPVIKVDISDFEDCWRLSVMDNGQGIPVEIQKNIFKSFFTTKQIGSGTGIGLALSRSIVENCGGSLNFQSDPNGTVFYADFPKAGALMPEAVEKAEHDSTQVPLRVLVVDDEEDIREILAEILSESNCIVTEAATAEIALKEVRAVEFDVIMTDMQMPGMDGLTLLSEINASKLAPLAVKAVITGGETKDIEDKISDFRLGTVDACLGKPFATEQLLGLLDMALRRKKVALKTAS